MDIEKIKLSPDIIDKYIPEALSVNGIAFMIASNRLMNRRFKELTMAFQNANHAYERFRLKNYDNNWLKMHGYPMRRKIKRRLKGL